MESKNWNIYNNHCIHKKTGYEVEFRSLFNEYSRKRIIEELKDKSWFTSLDEKELKTIGEFVFKKGTL